MRQDEKIENIFKEVKEEDDWCSASEIDQEFDLKTLKIPTAKLIVSFMLY